MQKRQNQDLGCLGEKFAVSFLKKEGYSIVTQNYRTLMGEIDIIAWDRNILCFIEVKTRVDDQSGEPLESINTKKQRKISQVALSYLQKHPWHDNDLRFDVVGVLLNEDLNIQKIDLIKNAFELDKRYFY
ncbi:MAG: YraN family protein [Candidatus Omnitrophota bacterium]